MGVIFGFRQRKRRLEALNSFDATRLVSSRKVPEKIGKAIRKTTAVLLDLKKVVDNVKYCIVVKKLEFLVMSGHMQDFSRLYFTDRQHCVNTARWCDHSNP